MPPAKRLISNAFTIIQVLQSGNNTGPGDPYINGINHLSHIDLPGAAAGFALTVQSGFMDFVSYSAGDHYPTDGRLFHSRPQIVTIRRAASAVPTIRSNGVPVAFTTNGSPPAGFTAGGTGIRLQVNPTYDVAVADLLIWGSGGFSDSQLAAMESALALKWGVDL
jgi:hypothetical protein